MYCVNMTLGENEDIRFENEEGRIDVVESVWYEDEYCNPIYFMYDVVNVYVENIENVVWIDMLGEEYVPDFYEIEGTFDDEVEVVNVYQWRATCLKSGICREV